MKEFVSGLEQYLSDMKNDLGEIMPKFIPEDFIKKYKPGDTEEKKVKDLSNLNLLDFLPYRSFNSKNSIFLNEKSLGFVMRVGHFSGINEASKQAIRNLINNDLPVNCTMQVINYASPRIGNLLDFWNKSSDSSPLFKRLSQRRYDFFKDASWESAIGNKGSLLIRDYELYFCFSMPRPLSDNGNEDIIFRMRGLQDKLTQGLRGINSDSYILNDRDLTNFLLEILSPSKTLYKPRATQSHENFREFLKVNQKIEMKKSSVAFSSDDFECNYRVYEITSFPEYWDLENSIDYIGIFDGGSSLPCPFYISFGFCLNSRDGSQRIADKHRMIKTQQNDSKLPMFFPKMLEENNDWHYVSSQISSGQRMGKMVMHVVLAITDTCDPDYAQQSLEDHFARLGFSITRVNHDTINSLVSTLPFGYGENWQIFDQLKISSKALSGACINLMPVFADGQNYSSPLMMFAGKRGQLFFFDNFHTSDDINGNFNMIIVGTSGRGKSVWLQEYTNSLLKNNGQVVIIDDGRSFKNLCELREGDFVDFGGGSFCINPFSLYQEAGDEVSQEYKENFEEPFIDLIVSILCIVINVDKNNNLDPEMGLYRNILAFAVLEVIRKKGKYGGFEDIRHELITNENITNSATRSIIDKIEYVLRNYSGDGRYAKYFNGKSTLDIKNRLTVFELSDLEHNEVLQSSALLTVTFLVYAKIRGRNTKTALIIDEFWRMGKHPVLKGPIGGFSRRGRKYNLSLIVASQCMSDFEASNSEAGAIALSQADWRIILSVDGKDDHILRKELMMSTGEIAIAHSLAGMKCAYSEFMIRHKNNSWQIGRLLLDPFSAKAYSTKAEDMSAIKEMRQNGIPIEDAIESLIEKKEKKEKKEKRS